jgi:hypothetical protein
MERTLLRQMDEGVGAATVGREVEGRSAARSSRAAWGGRALSGAAVAFLAFDAALKILRLPAAVEGTAQLGYPASATFGIGVVLAACIVVHLVPRTAVLGAVLLTGYLGGAVATQVRVGNPLFTHVLAAVYVAAFVWAGLWLRDRRVRALLGERGA